MVKQMHQGVRTRIQNSPLYPSYSFVDHSLRGIQIGTRVTAYRRIGDAIAQPVAVVEGQHRDQILELPKCMRTTQYNDMWRNISRIYIYYNIYIRVHRERQRERQRERDVNTCCTALCCVVLHCAVLYCAELE